MRANANGDEKLLSTVSLWTLARMHPEDKSLGRQAAEKLVTRLNDKDPFVRASAARALSALNLGRRSCCRSLKKRWLAPTRRRRTWPCRPWPGLAHRPCRAWSRR